VIGVLIGVFRLILFSFLNIEIMKELGQIIPTKQYMIQESIIYETVQFSKLQNQKEYSIEMIALTLVLLFEP